MANGGRGSDAQFSTAAVQGVQGTLPSGKKVGGGGGDAFSGVEGDAKVTVGGGLGNRGATKVPGGGGGG